MSFAKDQEEEVANVAGVAYGTNDDSNNHSTIGLDSGTQSSFIAPGSRARAMDVEIGHLPARRAARNQSSRHDPLENGDCYGDDDDEEEVLAELL